MTDTVTETSDTQPQVLAGRYEIRQLIGRGGMAEVRLGYDRRLSRIIAIKLLRSDIAGDPTFQARFRREAQAAAALNHPSIVAVYDSGEENLTAPDGTVRPVPYIVMEYVEGHTVRELLGEGEAVPINEAVEIVTGVLDALEYSHRAGIVHRDIKPGNIMLTSTGAVKVMDFGIARAVEDSSAQVTQAHAVVGTAQYLSPEQARGEVVDARSDLYSTGCLLFELLTGQPPFTGDSAVSIAYQHVREMPATPSSIAGDVPESLDRVVLKALAKNRDDRYQDAAHMRADLLAAVRGMPVSAPATATWIAPAAAAASLGAAAGAAAMNAGAAGAATQVVPGGIGGVIPGMGSATTVMQADAPTGTVPAVPPAPPEEEAEEGTKKTWLWVLVGIAVVAAAVAVGLGASGFFGGNNKPTPVASATPTSAAVPDVRGMSEADARQAIQGAGFDYRRGDDVADDSVKSGHAVSSNPEAGTSAVLGTVVRVSYSSGSAMVNVPDVSGMSQAEARQALEAAGLTMGTTSTEDNGGVASNSVIRTDPVAGTSVQRGSSVNLVLSSGQVTVPNLAGMTQEQARQALSQLGLSVGNVTQEESSSVAQGQIISTTPASGTQVSSGSEVAIVVSSGVSPNGTIPVDIVGKSQVEAETELAAAGFSNVTVQGNGSVVVSVSPSPGSVVSRQTRITITLGNNAPSNN